MTDTPAPLTALDSLLALCRDDPSPIMSALAPQAASELEQLRERAAELERLRARSVARFGPWVAMLERLTDLIQRLHDYAPPATHCHWQSRADYEAALRDADAILAPSQEPTP